MKFEDVDFTDKLPDGRTRYRLLKSGAVFDNSQNKIVARKITPDEAREMAHKRWDKYREATASRIVKEAQAIDSSIETEEDAWALVVAKTYIAIMDSDKPRGDDLEKVGRAMGAIPNITDVKQVIPQETDEDVKALIREVARLAARYERETVEGRVIDDSD